MRCRTSWCVKARETPETAKVKLMLADNRIFDLGVDDMAAFDSSILDLKDDLDIPGFDEDMDTAASVSENAVSGPENEGGLHTLADRVTTLEKLMIEKDQFIQKLEGIILEADLSLPEK